MSSKRNKHSPAIKALLDVYKDPKTEPAVHEFFENHYQPRMGGMASKMGTSITPEDLDYFVSIDRDDKFDKKGKSVGWTKSVHRYTEPKKKK